MTSDTDTRRVLLIPGGASTVHGYFPDLASALATRATVIESDPPSIGALSDGTPLRLSGYAHALARAVREGGNDSVGVIGHSLGGLVALRLAVDAPDVAAALLLLDPTPATPWLSLRAMAPFLRMLAALGPLGRRMWTAQARRDLRGASRSAEQERALRVYTDPRFLTENALGPAPRGRRHRAREGHRCRQASRAPHPRRLSGQAITQIAHPPGAPAASRIDPGEPPRGLGRHNSPAAHPAARQGSRSDAHAPRTRVEQRTGHEADYGRAYAYCLPRTTRRHKSKSSLHRRWRSTNLLERSLGEVKRRTKVMGRFPGETSCLTLVWAVLDLFTSHQTNDIRFTELDRQHLNRIHYQEPNHTTPEEVTAA